MNKPQPQRFDDRVAVDVALAEYNALRAEIVGTLTAQGAVVGVALTAIGLTFTFALQEAGERALLHGVPLLALIASTLHVAESYRMHRLGDYIRCKLWPWLQMRSGYPHSWEAEHAGGTVGTRGLATAVLLDGAVPALFTVAAATAVLLTEDAGWPLRLSGAAATVMTLVVPAAFGLALRRRRARERHEAERLEDPARRG